MYVHAWTGGLGISVLGTVIPNNTVVEAEGGFQLQCMPHDYWMHGNYWYIYFSLMSIVCRVYAAKEKGQTSDSVCTSPYPDISRFSAYRNSYVLMLDVENATTTDAGLYICARPPVHKTFGHFGLMAVVGVVRKFAPRLRNDLLCVEWDVKLY